MCMHRSFALCRIYLRCRRRTIETAPNQFRGSPLSIPLWRGIHSFIHSFICSHYPRIQTLPAASHYIQQLLLLSFVLSLIVASSSLLPQFCPCPLSYLIILVVLCS